ncbi:hypothetical protein GO298_02941 [Ralstonia solanacearum]|nr:hypothetical protein [Ralstonia solanacearum]
MDSIVSTQQCLNVMSLRTKILCESDFGRDWQE